MAQLLSHALQIMLELNQKASSNGGQKRKRKKINVPMRHALMLYNQKMGGVDLFDQFVATYRARIRSKKWWWPFFAWSLNAAMTNAWLLYKKIYGKNISMLAFMREIVATTLASSRRKKLSTLQHGQQVLKN